STIFRALEVGTIRAFFPEEGRTWLGGDRGLASYYPDVAVDPEREWHCRLLEVRGSGDSLLFGGTFSKRVSGEPLAVGSTTVERVPVNEQPDEMIPRLPFSKNRMEFTFAAAFPTQQKAVTYSHKLVGFDTAWSKWEKEANKEYTSLPEGTYTFRVKARNIYLEESTTAAYRFRILSPWYRSWGAYGGYTIAGIGLIWLIVWLNSRRLLAHKEKLEKIVNERTKEIREQKEKVEDQQKETERQKEKVEEAHQEITQSIDYAQKIQYALLRSEEQVSPHIPEHFILFKPRSQVSGDFYWGKEHKGYFYLAAVDCTGHGVPGAFMSMLGICQLNEIMNTEELLTPGYILTRLRDRVVGELTNADPENSARDGMDAALVRIPLGKEQGVRSKEGEGKSEEGEAGFEKSHPQGEGFNPHGQASEGSESTIDVEFAGAQNPLYVIRKGIGEDPPEVEGGEVKPFNKTPDGIEVKGDPMPVGYDEHASKDFSTASLWLRKGDMLYLFSDGYADQFGGPNAKKFRYGPFRQLLTSIYHNPLEEQKRELDKNFEDWREESQQEQIDDVVVIGVRL
ncbi:MAG: SpoIIE family protein phosphatase, partial [Flavobacteriales bacterium]